MKNWKPWLLSVVLVAGVALAGTVNITDIFVFQTLFRPWSRTTTQLAALSPSAWTGYVAYNSTLGKLVYSNGSAWTGPGFNTLGPFSTTYDFPVLSPTNSSGTDECLRSWNVTATGAVLTDGCFASNNFGVDGGAILPTNVHITCSVVAADTIAFDACAQLNDAGTINLTDAGYLGRILH